MELKEYYKILTQNKRLFWSVTFAVVAAGFAYFLFRPISYSASLTLNITRQGSQETPDYKFDGFYRLQADEKFAETVVQWLKSPRTVVDIHDGAGMDARNLTLRRLGKILKSEKLSSQVIAVGFSAKDPQAAKKISDSIIRVISKNTEDLNRKQTEPAWFAIEAHNPVIVKSGFSPVAVLIASLLLGIFVSFWAVMLAHYIK